MPIGKDSIQNRVAKAATPENAEAKAEPMVETAPAEVKPAPKKKSPAKKKPAAPKADKPAEETPKAEKPAETPAEPATAVLSNVAPETVEAVVGHKEDTPSDKVQIGQKMPHYLL